MKRRFGVLYTLGTVVVYVGVAGLALATLLLLVMLWQALDEGFVEVLGVLISSGASVLGALIVIGFGQAFQCFVVIEENTRQAAQVRREVAEQ